MNTTTPNTTTPDLSAIGTKHRALWASGDYPAVAADLVPGLGATLVQAAGITAGGRRGVRPDPRAARRRREGRRRW